MSIKDLRLWSLQRQLTAANERVSIGEYVSDQQAKQVTEWTSSLPQASCRTTVTVASRLRHDAFFKNSIFVMKDFQQLASSSRS